MAFNKILTCALLGAVAGQNSRTFPGFSLFSNDIQPTVSTTPIPILKYIDEHNTDGTYTYGYQSADGTYKIESRFLNGEVKGKYGYIDSDGIFKETSYGSGAELGFVPVIDGVKHAPQDSELSNLVEQPTPVRAPVARPRTDLPASRFNNFRPNEIRTDDTDVKVINGRRAVLRKRIRTDAINSSQVQEQQFQEEQQNEDNQELSREEQLRARQEGLKVWEQQRAALVQLQQLQQRQQPASRESVRSESSRGFNAFQPAAAAAAQETFRSFPDPYVTGVNLDSGSYTINY